MEAGRNKMKQITTRVDDNISKGFYIFCKKLKLSPYDLLGAIIDFYGRTEILNQKMEKGDLTKAEGIIEIGRIVSDMKIFSNANVEFIKSMSVILKPYGIKLDELGLTQEMEAIGFSPEQAKNKSNRLNIESKSSHQQKKRGENHG